MLSKGLFKSVSKYPTNIGLRAFGSTVPISNFEDTPLPLKQLTVMSYIFLCINLIRQIILINNNE